VLISAIKVEPMAASSVAYTWRCMDYVDGECTQETLAAKFKTEDIAKKFRAAFEDAIAKANGQANAAQVI